MELETHSHEGILFVPYMTNVSISYRNREGVVRQAPMRKGSAGDHYIATFDEDDVDFNVNIQNAHNPRCLFELRTAEGEDAFVSRENALSVLKSVVFADGMPAQRLHFRVRDATRPFDVPSIGRMHFSVSYSLIPTVTIHVRTLGCRTPLTFSMPINQTILQLKLLIYGRYRVSPFRQSIYHGPELITHNLAEVGKHFRDDICHAMVEFEAIPLFVEFVARSQVRAYSARPSDSIRDLEQLIQSEHSMLLTDFYLIFNDRLLAKDSTVLECGLGENAVIRMQSGPQTISVRCYNADLAIVHRENFSLDPIKTTDAQFREEIARIDAFSEANCCVHLSNLFGNASNAVGPITYPLCVVESYKQKIHDSHTFPVFVLVQGTQLRLNLESTTTIGQIRRRLERQFENEIDLADHEIRLKGSENILDDEATMAVLWPGCQLNMQTARKEEGPVYRALPVYMRPPPHIVGTIPDDADDTHRHSEEVRFHRNPKAMIKPFVIDLELSNEIK